MDGMGSNSGWWDGKVDGMVYADIPPTGNSWVVQITVMVMGW